MSTPTQFPRRNVLVRSDYRRLPCAHERCHESCRGLVRGRGTAASAGACGHTQGDGRSSRRALCRHTGPGGRVMGSVHRLPGWRTGNRGSADAQMRKGPACGASLMFGSLTYRRLSLGRTHPSAAGAVEACDAVHLAAACGAGRGDEVRGFARLGAHRVAPQLKQTHRPEVSWCIGAPQFGHMVRTSSG